MPVPELRSPDYSNALNIMLAGQQQKRQQETRDLQNAVLRNKLANAPELARIKRNAQAIKTAMRSKNQEEADNILNIMAPELVGKVRKEGKDITLRLPNGYEVTIPEKDKDVFDIDAINLTDPQKISQMFNWGVQHGWGIKAPKPEKPTTGEYERLVEKMMNLPEGPKGDEARKFYQRRIDKLTAKSKEGESAESKDLKRLEDDIIQQLNKAYSIESGQDIVDISLGSKAPEVSRTIHKQVSGMLKDYRDKGGKVSRFGISDKEFAIRYFKDTGKWLDDIPVTKEDIKAAYQSGMFSLEESKKILMERF